MENPVVTRPGRMMRYMIMVFNVCCVLVPGHLLFRRQADTFKYRPVFIIGPPRSGSTLCSQLIIEAFDMGCLTNMHCLFYRSPALAEKLFGNVKRRTASHYKSEFGITSGRFEPSECRQFWYRFFPGRNRHLEVSDVNSEKMKLLRHELQTLSGLQGRSLLLKNLYTTLRLRPVAKYLPEALFIIIKRDELANARSLLHARMLLLGNYEKWWSVPVPGKEALLKRPPEEQVVEQIRAIRQLIHQDICEDEHGTPRFMEIDYEELCQDTCKVLNRVETFFRQHGLQVTNRYTGPASFTIRNNGLFPREMDNRLVDYIKGSS